MKARITLATQKIMSIYTFYPGDTEYDNSAQEVLGKADPDAAKANYVVNTHICMCLLPQEACTNMHQHNACCCIYLLWKLCHNSSCSTRLFMSSLHCIAQISHYSAYFCCTHDARGTQVPIDANGIDTSSVSRADRIAGKGLPEQYSQEHL